MFVTGVHSTCATVFLASVLTLGYWDVVPDLALYSSEPLNSGPHT